jgi:class 3 adenylate cyclase
MQFSFDISDIKGKVDREIEKIRRENLLQAIAIFDLTGSTSLKTQRGHEFGTRKSLSAVLLSKLVVEHFDGINVKELGDGILCRFNNPVKACLAALSLKSHAPKLGIKVTGGITLGMVDLLSLNENSIDIYGTPVDKCARISSFCLPGQILIDRALLDSIKSQLLDFNNIEIGEGKKRILKDFGVTELFEISVSEIRLRDYMHTPFRVHEEGRLPLSDKAYFARGAQQHLVEMGTGLTTFSKWFSGERPAEFRDYIENLLRKGVNVSFLLLDKNWSGSKMYLADRGEPDYIDDISRSLKYLRDEQERLLKLYLPGAFQLYFYSSFPNMNILCVDPEDEINGRMLVSPYLYGLSRSECPVLEFSRLSNPQLFEKYWKSLSSLMKRKSELM